MGLKGDATRAAIIDATKELFIKKGFKDVTMSDICDATGLSRGGLYRHFSSPAEIFAELAGNEFSFDERIEKGESAKRILSDAFWQISEQILNPSGSLSFAIYEYAKAGHTDVYRAIDERARKNWGSLIEYGIRSHEFKRVKTESMVELILYYSQGLLLWAHVQHFDKNTVQNYIDTISDILCK